MKNSDVLSPKQLTKLRQNRKMTRLELAELLGVTYYAVYRWEHEGVHNRGISAPMVKLIKLRLHDRRRTMRRRVKRGAFWLEEKA